MPWPSTPLYPSRKKEIRTITILPGLANDTIRCQLQTVSLEDTPQYEALSYVWGSPENSVDIELGSVRKSVTRNLYEALRRLRFPDASRILWVNAICINQADDEEKGQQVAMMGEIYSKTERCLIFLGEAEEHNEALEERRLLVDFFTGKLPTGWEGLQGLQAQFHAIEREASSDLSGVMRQIVGGLSRQPAPRDNIIRKTRECVWRADDRDLALLREADDKSLADDTIFHAFCLLRRLVMDAHPSETGYFTSEVEDGIRYPSSAVRALKWLGERPWWKRIWTVQECILPPQCTVVYGPVQAPLSMFFDSMQNLQRHRNSCCASDPGIGTALSSLSVVINHLQDVQTWRQENRPIPLSSLMKIFRYRQATDPRDKIYGLLGLATDYSTFETPVYNEVVTKEQIFARTTAAIIKSTGSLDILCQHGNLDINYFSTLPSWVIDYSLPISELGTTDRYHHQIPLYNAGRGTTAKATNIENSILVLEGVAVDRLSTVGEVMSVPYGPPRPDILKQWLELASQAENTSPNWKQDFWRVICGDVEVDCAATYRRIGRTADTEPSPDEWIAIQDGTGTPNRPEVKAATALRKFFVGEKGHMGLAPETAGRAATLVFGKEQVFVIPGGKTPFLLRSAGVRHVPGLGMKLCHHLIGDCYLHGFMDGEAMQDFDKNKQAIYLV
ncbi:hypothetical protein RB595_002099 [Gaeumannomyces hyphopodioides]